MLISEVVTIKADLLASMIILYSLLSAIKKQPIFICSFILCELLFMLSFFDAVSEWALYIIELNIFLYVFSYCDKMINKFFCAALCFISFLCSVEAVLYAESYGQYLYFLHKNIEYISFCTHFLFICSFVDLQAVRNSASRFIDYINSLPFIRYTAFSMQFNLEQKTL